MKVLLLTPWYPDKTSLNSGLFIRSQAVALSEQHQVMVISSKVNYKKFALSSYLIDTVQNGSLTEHRLTIFKSLPFYNQINHLLITFSVSRRIAKAFKPDIIHASIGYPGAIWGWALSKVLGVPFIFTEHTRLTNNFRSRFHRILTLYGLKRANVVTTVSRVMARELMPYVRKEVLIIPNIVESKKFENVKPAVSSIPQFGFLGGMNTPVKGLDILLEAVSSMKQDFVLHIGGSGSLLETYKALAVQLKIDAKCKFYGFINPDQLPEFMSKIQFLVCSSRYETFCVSLVEAMACGMPVVSTRCGGPEDFVNESNGILCEKEDPGKLQMALEQMIIDAYTRYSPVVLKQTAKNYSPQNFVIRITDAYSAVMR